MHFTQNPIGSDDQLDLQDNAISFDYAMNSPAALWQDRFGKQHKTVQQALKDVGFKPAGFDFVSGGTLGLGDRDKCVFYPTDGYWYSWNGKLPYVVPVNSSPTPGGKKGWGVVTRDERVVAREALRRTYLEAGLNLVEGSFEAGGTLVNANDVLLQERTGKVFSYSGTYPHTVAAGDTPISAGWSASSELTLRMGLAGSDGATFNLSTTATSFGIPFASFAVWSSGATSDTEKYWWYDNKVWQSNSAGHVLESSPSFSTAHIVPVDGVYLPEHFGAVPGQDCTTAFLRCYQKTGVITLTQGALPYKLGALEFPSKVAIRAIGAPVIEMLQGDGLTPALWFKGDDSYLDPAITIDCATTTRTVVRVDASRVTAHCRVKNQRSVSGSANTTCGLHLATGNRFRGSIHYVDAANAGHPNESVPRAVSIDSVFGKYQLDYMHLENNDSGGLVTTGGDGVIGQIICRNITDQCIYSIPALSGNGAQIKVGEINIDAGEEGVVAGGKSIIDIGHINISSRSGFVLGVQDLTGCLNVGTISFLSTSVGGVVEAPTVTGILRTRSGNTSSPGKVFIGGVYGTAKLGATFGVIAGTLGQISIGQSDVLFVYDAAFANTTSQFMNLSGCQRYSVRNFKMTIYDKDDVLTAASIFTVSLPVSPLATSDWSDVEYYVNTSTNAVSAAQVRVAGLDHANVQAKGVRWQHNVGPYGREATCGPKDSITGVPTIGYWPVNTDLILTGKTAAPFRARVTAAGTPGTWVSY